MLYNYIVLLAGQVLALNRSISFHIFATSGDVK